MTVNSEIPRVQYTGNGVSVKYPFSWSSGEFNDNYVSLNGVLLAEGVEYELEEYTEEYGGQIVFYNPPVAGDSIIIFRDTPVTQQVDYVDGEPFPADIHERQMDKDTRILQELIEGGRALGGTVDLAADQQPEYTDITNSRGTDARIIPWGIDGLSSGVALGEVIPFGSTPPQDTAPTDKVSGYIWWVLGQPADAGGDARITMWTSSIIVYSEEISPAAPRAQFKYFAANGTIGYGYDELIPLATPEWTTQPGFNPAITVPGTYLIQLEKTSGPDPTGSPVDVWLDAVSDADWVVTDGKFVGIINAAPDSGGGVPDETKKISKYVTLEAVQN